MDQQAMASLGDLRSATEQQIDQYRTAGHTLIDGVLEPHEIDVFRRPIAAAVERARAVAPPIDERSTYDRAFLQLYHLWRTDPVVEQFVMASRLSSIAASLLGVDRVRIYHDQALFKEPGGGFTPWHQDALYWPLDGLRCITMWMPLIDIVPEMGAMTFAEGSHLDRCLSTETISDESEIDFRQLVEHNGYTFSTPRSMHAGDATFHSGWTAHRAGANSTATMRSVMTIIWFADGERVVAPVNAAQERDLAMWLPGCRPTDAAASPINPVLPVASATHEHR